MELRANETIKLNPNSTEWYNVDYANIPNGTSCLNGNNFIKTNRRVWNKTITLKNNSSYFLEFDLANIDIKPNDHAFIQITDDTGTYQYQITGQKLQHENKNSCEIKPNSGGVSSTSSINRQSIKDFSNQFGIRNKTISIEIFLVTKDNSSSNKSSFNISEIRIGGTTPHFFMKIFNSFKTLIGIADDSPQDDGNPDSGTTGPRRPPL